MSDRWLNKQHEEIKDRARQRRLAQMAQAEQLRQQRRERSQ